MEGHPSGPEKAAEVVILVVFDREWKDHCGSRVEVFMMRRR